MLPRGSACQLERFPDRRRSAACSPAPKRIKNIRNSRQALRRPPLTRNRGRRERAPRRNPSDRPRALEDTPPPTPPKAAHREEKRDRRDSGVARIYGFHSVEAALKARHRELVRLYATEAAAARLAAEIAARGVETRIMSVAEIAARAPREAVHQGVLLEARPLAPIDVGDLPADGFVIALGHAFFPLRSPRPLELEQRIVS